jgi:putative ABC transport system ATP-binding protein
MAAPAMSSIVLRASHLAKRFHEGDLDVHVLRGVDLDVRGGETLAIVGASGSGKSTLLSIIAGLDTPSEGTVRLAGVDLFAIDEDARAAVRAEKLGFVFQSFQLLANLDALENVMLPLELQGRSDARAQATEMLKRVGLGERLRHYPRVLSGGEQQRVALARAFVVKPALLLADEPTGSLDFATGETVISLMFELNRAGAGHARQRHRRALRPAAADRGRADRRLSGADPGAFAAPGMSREAAAQLVNL